MKNGFSLVEIIISISLISLIFIFTFVIIKKAEPTYADPYEEIRLLISDAANVYLNSNVGIEFRENLYKDGKVVIYSDDLIKEGLIEESYFIKNINEKKDLQNIEIIIELDDEGFINYSINIV